MPFALTTDQSPSNLLLDNFASTLMLNMFGAALDQGAGMEAVLPQTPLHISLLMGFSLNLGGLSKHKLKI